MSTPSLPAYSFLGWWEAVNRHLADKQLPEMLWHDARGYRDQGLTPSEAADRHAIVLRGAA